MIIDKVICVLKVLHSFYLLLYFGLKYNYIITPSFLSSLIFCFLLLFYFFKNTYSFFVALFFNLTLTHLYLCYFGRNLPFTWVSGAPCSFPIFWSGSSASSRRSVCFSSLALALQGTGIFVDSFSPPSSLGIVESSPVFRTDANP